MMERLQIVKSGGQFALGVAGLLLIAVEAEVAMDYYSLREIDPSEGGSIRAQLEHAIALLEGKPASEFSLPSAPLDALPPVIPSGLSSELLGRRPDIAEAERMRVHSRAQNGLSAMQSQVP